MAETKIPIPVKLFAAVLWADNFDHAAALMEKEWGKIDYQGADYPFDITDYYEKEMGKDLKRRILSFEKLVCPDVLVKAKLAANRQEDYLCRGGKRTVNIDVGILDHNKIVLASLKGAGQKIYLSEGIYADLAARFSDGEYRCFEWSFPDFKQGRYAADLLKIRALYLRQLKV